MPPSPGSPTGHTDALALLGPIYSCLSIIVVFQMFTLQTWLQDALGLDRLSWDTDEHFPFDSLERQRVIGRISVQKSAFPVAQVLALAATLVGICSLGLSLAVKVDTLSRIYTAGPILVLGLVFVAITIAIRQKGMSVLTAAEGRLETPNAAAP